MGPVKFSLDGLTLSVYNDGRKEIVGKANGVVHAVGAWGANAEGLIKFGGTLADVVHYTTGADDVGPFHLGNANAGLMTAGSACAVSKAWVATFKTVGHVQRGTILTKDGASSAFAAVGETAATAVCLHKMGGLDIDPAILPVLKMTKEIGAVAVDILKVYDDVTGVSEAELQRKVVEVTPDVIAAKSQENWCAIVRNIVGLSLHFYLFLGVALGFPLMPAAVCLFASVYIATITVWHFVKSRADDLQRPCVAGIANVH